MAEQINSMRRLVLKSLPAAGMALAVPAAQAAPAQDATEEELKRYFAFLRMELRSVIEDLKIDEFDHSVFWEAGGKAAYQQAFPQPARARARAVLAMGGNWNKGATA